MPIENIIEVTNLHVRYGALTAVDGLCIAVKSGEVFGLLGPNGAGKSSILGCIEGLRRPTQGMVRIAGMDVVAQPQQVKRLLGVQLQKSALFENLSVVELIDLYAALYEVFPTTAQRDALLARFGLTQKATARARQLSGGQQQRLSLLLAVINDPQIVLLDEPTTGLDPQARRGIWALIRHLQAEGRTVLLTTHYLEEAEALCDRVGIIDGGKLIALDTPQALVQRYAPPLAPAEAARRPPNLEDAYIALTGRTLATGDHTQDEDSAWLASLA